MNFSDDIKVLLSQFIEDKGKPNLNKYFIKGKKSKGKSHGYVISSDDETEQLYMVKAAARQRSQTFIENIESSSDKRDFISEYITSPIYKRLLKDRAPVIGLYRQVKDNLKQSKKETEIKKDEIIEVDHVIDEEDKYIYLKSKYLKDFKSIKDSKFFFIKAIKSINEENPLKNDQIAIGVVNGNLCWQTLDSEAIPIKFFPDRIKNIKAHTKLIPEIRLNETEVINIDDYYRDVFKRLKKYIINDESFAIKLSKLMPSSVKFNGFEKVIAAALFLEDADYHYENIGFFTNEHGERYLAKIDHGRSGYNLGKHKNSFELMQSFIDQREDLGIDGIEFDPRDFKKAVEEVLTISDQEIEDLIKSRVYLLKREGFKLDNFYYSEDIEGAKFVSRKDNLKDDEIYVSKSLLRSNIICQARGKNKIVFNKDKEGRVIGKISDNKEILIEDLSFSDLKLLLTKTSYNNLLKFTEIKEKFLRFLTEIGYIRDSNKISYKKLEEFFISALKKQKEIFAELNEDLKVITKIDAENIDFFTEEWILEIYGGKQKRDPIEFAIERSLTIEGKKPLIWALANSHKIKNMDAASWMLKHGYRTNNIMEMAILNDIKINGSDPLVWAVKSGYRILYNPIRWAIENESKLQKEESILSAFLLDICAKSNITLIKEYIKLGGKLDIPINKQGDTILTKAVRDNNLKVVHMLLQAGANLEIKNLQNNGINISAKMLEILKNYSSRANLTKKGFIDKAFLKSY